MPTNPFSKKASKRSVVSKTETPLASTLPNDEATLQARAERRQHIDFEPISLEVRNQTNTKYYERSFVSLVHEHPHHEFLIKQLLHGAALDIGNRLTAMTTHQDCYQGIEEFIDCLNSQGQSHQKPIRYVADINFQTTRSFVAYLLQAFPGRVSNRKHYGRVRTVINILQKKYESNPYVGKPVAWAQSPAMTEMPSESYSDEVFSQLIEACFTDIKFIMSTMAAYPDQLKVAKEIIPGLKYRVRKSGAIVGVSREENNRICSALVSANSPNWPFFESFEKASRAFSVEWYQTLPLDDIDNRYLYRAITGMRIVEDIKFQGSGEMKNICLEKGQAAYFCQFFFTIQTIYPFILFVQINTGWNMEAVLNLTDNLDMHLGEDIIDPDQYILIYSTKQRTEDVVCCRSNKVHPHSVYNILRFVQRQIEPFKKSTHYRSGYLWQGILSKNLWGKYGYIVVPLGEANVRNASRAFLKRHGISIQSNAKSPGIESRRIRTTFETKRKEQGLRIESVSEMMGHENVETTDVYYDRDSGSTNLKNKKLRQLQIGWESDFRNYGVRLSLSTSLAQLRQAISNSIESNAISKTAAELGIDKKAVVHLVSPGGQNYIAACLDSKLPSWPDAARFVSPGEKCSYFNRCCMCKQAVLFKESLPYVARRIMDLNRLKTRINSFEWSSNYGEETTAWEQILCNWNPSSDVDEAKKSATDSQYALPLTMRGAQ